MLPRTLYLTWHGIGERHDGVSAAEANYWVPPSVFADTIAALADIEARHGLNLQMAFDDGNLSDYSEAFPRLLNLQRGGLFFVCAGRINAPRYLSAAQLREMHAAGMTIGSHGFDHIDWRVATDQQLQRETTGARDRIEDVIGASVAAAAVPFGSFDGRTLQYLRGAGFTRFFTSSGGFATGRSGLIPRTSIGAGFDPMTDIERLAAIGCRAKSAVRDPIRRLRYWAASLARHAPRESQSLIRS
jgi:peptidoglycan/xylan/chitin deacetylase (PgdA/CDA1 family)